jgi:transcriptional/translational regulatory protein YebC/TACO1
MMLNNPKRRFPLGRILNIDETPIPFHFLSGSTWETLGATTVAGKVDRSGWDKRQATLILYIFADGVPRTMPTIIFHGNPTDERGQIWKEHELYHPDVIVEYNDHAYNNEELFSCWIDTVLLKIRQEEEEDFLLVMDAAAFHKTAEIKRKLREQNITVAMIPSGCTCLLQPLDTAVNKPFKEWLEEAIDEYEERIIAEKGSDFKWSVSDKRVMITHVVARACERLNSAEGAEIVRKSFLNCGISILPDGSEDSFIKIKGIKDDEINFTGWETAEEIVIEDDAPVDSLCDDEELIEADDDDLLLLTRYHEEVVKKLQARLRKRGLKTSGRKAELIHRLRDDDNSQKSQAQREQSCIEVHQSIENG